MSYDSPPDITPRTEPTRHSALPGKRVFDLLGATVILLLVLPVMIVVALVVLVTDGRPILFRQVRVGRQGRLFKILKFRTMVADAERMLDDLKAQNERRGPLFKMAHDPRVTRVGRFLRDSSLDELPQLLNVIRGDMSLVGPRPALPEETLEFRYKHLTARQQVRPGITGLWQISARDEAGFEAYERLDLMYIEHLSPRLDLAILLCTVPVVIGGAARRLTGSTPPATRAGARASMPWQASAWYGRDLLEAQPLRSSAGSHTQER